MIRTLHTLIVVSLVFCAFTARGATFGERNNGSPPDPNNNLLASSFEVDELVSFSFYPNPVKNVINVKFKQRGDYSLKIYNVVGTKLKEANIENDASIQIDVSDLPKGVYFISYEPGNGKAVTKTFNKDQ